MLSAKTVAILFTISIILILLYKNLPKKYWNKKINDRNLETSNGYSCIEEHGLNERKWDEYCDENQETHNSCDRTGAKILFYTKDGYPNYDRYLGGVCGFNKLTKILTQQFNAKIALVDVIINSDDEYMTLLRPNLTDEYENPIKYKGSFDYNSVINWLRKMHL